jgi:hypothetical protein
LPGFGPGESEINDPKITPDESVPSLIGIRDESAIMNTGLVPRFPHRKTALVPFIAAAAVFVLLGASVSPAHALGVPLYSINQTQSGLVASDPLNSQLSQAQLSSSSFWTFGGDAIGLSAPYAYNEDSAGLHIGVQSPASGPYAGDYAGFYALHIANAMLAHATLSVPSRTVSSGYPNVGLYVQTGGINVDYVVCGATTSSAGTYWGVAMAQGNTNGAFSYQPLYLDQSANQALTRECTIVTNGQNYLAVYLDGSQVYKSSNLNLGYQAPFQFFLETQTSYTGGMFTGSFQNFYLTSSDSVMVTGMPSGSTAEIVSPSGQVLASAPESSGTATLEVAQYDMPIVANIQVTSLLGLSIASTSSPVSIWGGDSYSLSLLGIGGGGGLLGAATVPGTSVASATGSVAQVSTSASLPVNTTAAPLSTLSLVGLAGLAIRRDPEGLLPGGSSSGPESLSQGREEQR